MGSTLWSRKTSNRDRGKATGRRRVLVAGVAAATLSGGIGAIPASALEPYGAPLPNYDPGVNGTINYDLANCGIVLYQHANYQGKKICGPALGNDYLSQLYSLNLPEATNFGADMGWSLRVSSVQVRPGFSVELFNFGSNWGSRSYTQDTPSLGDFNDLATHVRVGALNWGRGNNNAADGQPVTTRNAVSCISSQGPEKAVDNSVASIYVNKWCGAPAQLVAPWQTPPTLQVDLGADRLISGVVVHHAGDGPLTTLLGLKVQREPDLYNTKAYNIRISSLPTGPWTSVGSFTNTWSADVSNHRLMSADNRLYSARFVQLEVTQGSSADYIARIQEFEVLTLNR